jgi:hypothetical protein
VELADPKSGIVERFCDGGLVSNSPALLGYAEAVYHLQEDPKNIAILSLGTPRADLAERHSDLSRAKKTDNRGLWGWDLGRRIIDLTIDGGAMASDGVLKRIAEPAGARYSRIALSQPKGVALDLVTPETTRTLLQLGADHARLAAVRHVVEPFFTNADLEKR